MFELLRQGLVDLVIVNLPVDKVNDIEIPYDIKPRRAGDVAECYADASKAEKLLGWKAENKLEASEIRAEDVPQIRKSEATTPTQISSKLTLNSNEVKTLDFLKDEYVNSNEKKFNISIKNNSSRFLNLWKTAR